MIEAGPLNTKKETTIIYDDCFYSALSHVEMQQMLVNSATDLSVYSQLETW